MMAEMQGMHKGMGMRKHLHFCQEDDIDCFTSNAWGSEEAGLFLDEKTPSHLRGLKDYEIEFLSTLRSTGKKEKAIHRC